VVHCWARWRRSSAVMSRRRVRVRRHGRCVCTEEEERDGEVVAARGEGEEGVQVEQLARGGARGLRVDDQVKGRLRLCQQRKKIIRD